MAEPVGLASGLLTLAIFAFQSSVTLYNTIKDFQSHPKRVRDLLEELEALSGVLGPLLETVESTTEVDLSPLELPLLRCGNACKDFEQELRKCSSRSGGDRRSFRDWAKLKYMGDDIDGFRNLLAGYKATINIALTDASLRKSSVTAENLESYKDLIKTATEDLQSHLESIDQKLNDLVGQSVTESEPDAADLILIEQERLSTQKCLQICDQLSSHIDQLQLSSKRSPQPSEAGESDNFSEKVTKEGLEACKESLTLTAARLGKHMKDLTDHMVKKSKATMTSEEDVADLTRLQEQWEAAYQCIDICSKANEHLKENVSTIDNYGVGDAVQFLVSTNGKVIHGKNRGLGWRTRQVGGYLSDNAIMQISRDMTTINLKATGREAHSSGNDTQSVPDDSAETGQASEFNERHGRGVRLAPKVSPDVVTSPTRPSENQRYGLPKQ